MNEQNNSTPDVDLSGFAPPTSETTPVTAPSASPESPATAADLLSGTTSPTTAPASPDDAKAAAAATNSDPVATGEAAPPQTPIPDIPDIPDFLTLQKEITGKAQKKQKKGWKGIALAVGCVIVVLGIGSGIAYAASDTVKNVVKQNVSSAEDYYKWVIEKNTKDWGQSFSERYETLLSIAEDESQSELTLDVTLTEDGKNKVQEALNEELQTEYTMTLSTVSMVLTGKTDADQFSGTMTLTLNDTQVLEGNAILASDTLYFQIPSVSEQYLSFSLDDAATELEDTNTADALATSSSFFLTPEQWQDRLAPSDLNTLFQKYGELVAENDATLALLKDQTMSISSTDFSYTALEVTYEGSQLPELATEILMDMKEDSILSQYFTASGSMTEEDYQNQIQDMLDNLSTEADNKITVTYYLDASGTIRGCKLAEEDSESALLDCFVGKEGSSLGIYFHIGDDFSYDTTTASGTLTETKDVYSGTITLTETADTESTETTLEIQNFSIVDEDHGYCAGTITYTAAEQSPLLIALESDGSSQTFSTEWKEGDTSYGTIACTINPSNQEMESLTIPDDALSLQDDTTQDTYLGDGTAMKSVFASAGTALSISDPDAFAERLYEDWFGDGISEEESEEDSDYEDEETGDTTGDGEVTTEPTDPETPTEESTETTTEDTGSGLPYEQQLDADLGVATVTYNGGKLFQFQSSNADLLALVDCTQQPTIEANSENWYSNADGTLTIGLENRTATGAGVETCSIVELKVYEGTPSDIRVGIVGIGSTVADLEAQFAIDVAEEANTADPYIVSIYDTTTNGQKAYSFYLQNGIVTAFDLVDYSGSLSTDSVSEPVQTIPADDTIAES